MDSESVKSEIIKQVKTQYALDNARQLIEKVNEHCFEKCVAKPGASLSSSEQTCFTQCMEKYMSAWNQVSSTYINRLQQAD
ncbi:Tim10/DDP family zinc finger-domain-containing protein [Hypoxylon crocopeplum]|nr:Tim10/DDP family zinc finger-domain-containing protein [Hypoxylon crocopeplum]